MKDLLNCPNCGAPIERDYCPYCGSVFLDWACFDLSRPTYVKIRTSDGCYSLVKLALESVDSEYKDTAVPFYADDTPILRLMSPELSIEARFRAVPFRHYLHPDGDVLRIMIDPVKADPQIVSDVLRGRDRDAGT